MNVQRRLHFNSKQHRQQSCRRRRRRFSHRTQLTIILLTRFEVFDKYILIYIRKRRSQFSTDTLRVASLQKWCAVAAQIVSASM